LYLAVADADAFGWTQRAHFSLTVISQIDEMLHASKNTSHTFEAGEDDWGFTQLVALSELYDVSKGFMVDDTVIINCEITVTEKSYL